MELVFTRTALLDVDLPEEVLSSAYEQLWRGSLRGVAKQVLARNGVTDDVAFMIDGSAAYAESVSNALRTMSGLITAKTSRESYARHAGRFADWAASQALSLENIPAKALADYKRQRRSASKITGASWNVEAAAIRRLLDAAQINSGNLNGANPAAHPLLQWTEKGAGISGGEVPKFITGKQFRTFRDNGLQAMAYPLRNTAFAGLLVSSGMRRSEGGGYRQKSLPSQEAIAATDGGSIRHFVRKDTAKGRKARWTRISKQALETMWQYKLYERSDLLARRSSPDSESDDVPEFWLSQTGSPMTSSSWQYVFERASVLSGVEVTPHALRHTFAVFLLSRLISKTITSAKERRSEATRLKRVFNTRPEQIYDSLFGDPLRKVQKYLGHASYRTTFIYLDLLAGDTLEEDDTWGVFSQILDTEADYSTPGEVTLTDDDDDDDE
ncbi:site-specific integrase [Roseomonas sp. KE2513]|uniref:tyrosine-type recombinase/integrase n=1 Tax=Roseomonas sp. KE2513 TaxID=2479202 RepID=UPI0018DFC491|nr:site-specific integrase [Roseomonas sp. KE2513]MBI0538109.1 site-specific integrase [Roseomonas sp. KE2513]